MNEENCALKLVDEIGINIYKRFCRGSAASLAVFPNCFLFNRNSSSIVPTNFRWKCYYFKASCLLTARKKTNEIFILCSECQGDWKSGWISLQLCIRCSPVPCDQIVIYLEQTIAQACCYEFDIHTIPFL